MYEYICQHALVVKGKRRETHYFDWRFNKSLPPPRGLYYNNNNNCSSSNNTTNNNIMSVEDIPANKAHLDYYLNFYHVEQLKKHTSLITGWQIFIIYIYIYM